MEESDSNFSEDSDEEVEPVKNEKEHAGKLELIQLTDFMCHKSFSMKFGKNINFITGQNGSGKSAIVAALQICLGLSARKTNRGTKMQNLIRHGSVGSAHVKVTLNNEGSDAFKPEIYGKKITIERVIMRTGQTNFKIMDSTGKIRSQTKKEVEAIRERFNLFVENPVCILDQESAKSFLKGSSKEKYELFFRATNLLMFKNHINEEALIHESSFREYKEKKKTLIPLKDNIRKYEKQLQEAKSLDTLEKESEEIKKKIVWLKYYSKEYEAKEIQEQALARENKIKRLEERLQLKESESESHRMKVQSFTEAVKSKSKETKDIKKELEEICAKKDSVNAPISKAKIDLAKAKSQLTRYKENMQTFKDRLVQLQQKAEETDVRDQKTKKRELKQTYGNVMAKFEKQQDEQKHLESKEYSLRSAKESIVEELKELDRQLKTTENKIRRNEEDYQRLNDAMDKREAIFGKYVPHILDIIDNNRHRFSRLPIHIGLSVSLKDASYWKPVEKFLKGDLVSFICNNTKDAQILRSLCKAKGINILSIKTTKFLDRRHNIPTVTSELTGKKLLTIVDVLEISDDNVFNALVDSKSIEMHVLMPSMELAQQETYLGSKYNKKMPRGMKATFSRDGSKFYVRRGTEVSEMNRSTQQQPRYFSGAQQMDIEKNKLVAELDQLSLEKKHHNSNRGKLFEKIKTVEKEINQIRANLKDMVRDKGATQRTLNDLQTQLESEEFDNDHLDIQISDTKQSIEAGEETISNQEEKVNQAILVLEQLKASFAPLKNLITEKQALFNESKQALRDLEADLEMAEDAYKPSMLRINALNAKIKKSEKEFEEKQSAFVTLNDKLPAIKEQCKSATGLLFSLSDLSISTTEDIDKQVIISMENKLSIHLDKVLKRYELEKKKRKLTEYDKDVVVPQIEANLEAAKASYIKRKSHLKIVKSRLLATREQNHQRQENWEAFKQYTQHRTTQMFNYYLTQRNHEGSVNFDDDTKTLSFTWKKDAGTENRGDSNGQKNIGQLSGGEKSFTTLAFLLAMGSVTKSPFRVMDEFDVFMDPANRQIALQQVCNLARENKMCQYIFITPNDITSVPDGKDVRKVRMMPVQQDYGGKQQSTLI